jgi:hypothetical protein
LPVLPGGKRQRCETVADSTVRDTSAALDNDE